MYVYGSSRLSGRGLRITLNKFLSRRFPFKKDLIQLKCIKGGYGLIWEWIKAMNSQDWFGSSCQNRALKISLIH